MEKSGLDALKRAVQSLWQLENELRYSAWSALTLEKERAQHHVSEVRRHLNVLLNEADPISQMVDQPPVLDDKT